MNANPVTELDVLLADVGDAVATGGSLDDIELTVESVARIVMLADASSFGGTPARFPCFLRRLDVPPCPQCLRQRACHTSIVLKCFVSKCRHAARLWLRLCGCRQERAL
jgi:hypothetical protein